MGLLSSSVHCFIQEYICQAWLDRRWTYVALMIRPRRQEEGIGIPAPGGVPVCSQSCSQLITRSLPSLQLLAADISDHPQAPLGRRVAEEGGARGEVLEWRKFSPVKTEVISKPLKDTSVQSPDLRPDTLRPWHDHATSDEARGSRPQPFAAPTVPQGGDEQQPRSACRTWGRPRRTAPQSAPNRPWARARAWHTSGTPLEPRH